MRGFFAVKTSGFLVLAAALGGFAFRLKGDLLATSNQAAERNHNKQYPRKRYYILAFVYMFHHSGQDTTA